MPIKTSVQRPALGQHIPMHHPDLMNETRARHRETEIGKRRRCTARGMSILDRVWAVALPTDMSGAWAGETVQGN